jgi:hypothetical protein
VYEALPLLVACILIFSCSARVCGYEIEDACDAKLSNRLRWDSFDDYISNKILTMMWPARFRFPDFKYISRTGNYTQVRWERNGKDSFYFTNDNQLSFRPTCENRRISPSFFRLGSRGIAGVQQEEPNLEEGSG